MKLFIKHLVAIQQDLLLHDDIKDIFCEYFNVYQTILAAETLLDGVPDFVGVEVEVEHVRLGGALFYIQN